MKFYEAVMHQVATGLDPLFIFPPPPLLTLIREENSITTALMSTPSPSRRQDTMKHRA